MPPELAEAMTIDGLCRRYSCLPSQLLAEDMDVLRIANLAILGQPDTEG